MEKLVVKNVIRMLFYVQGIFILSFKITYFRFTSEYRLQKYPRIKLM